MKQIRKNDTPSFQIEETVATPEMIKKLVGDNTPDENEEPVVLKHAQPKPQQVQPAKPIQQNTTHKAAEPKQLIANQKPKVAPLVVQKAPIKKPAALAPKTISAYVPDEPTQAPFLEPQPVVQKQIIPAMPVQPILQAAPVKPEQIVTDNSVDAISEGIAATVDQLSGSIPEKAAGQNELE